MPLIDPHPEDAMDDDEIEQDEDYGPEEDTGEDTNVEDWS